MKTTITLSCKCSDSFWFRINGHSEDYLGYVPAFAGSDSEDYINLEIDAETGQILNWTPQSREDLIKIIEGNNV